MPRPTAPARTALMLVAALACAATIAPVYLHAANRPTVAQVAEGLTCQCGCGLTVANCNMPTCEFSVPVRAEIAKMIDRGMSAHQILAVYRAKYGEKVLSAPTTQGFNILAWIMPFAAVAIGGGFIVWTANRWRSTAPAEPMPGDKPSGAGGSIAGKFDPALKRRLDDELREQI